MYKFKRGIKLDYVEQGYIFFTARRFKKLNKKMQDAIVELCRECAGEYYAALLEFVTTDASATAISIKYYIDRSTLYRKVKIFYENFYKIEKLSARR